jgi:regulator of extracellular matrix RemA (YlzA/DUF370 family)
MSFNKPVNIGFGNIVMSQRIVALVSNESAPIKRIIQEARDRGRLIDCTHGRRTRAVIITDTDYVVVSALLPETISVRVSFKDDVKEDLTKEIKKELESEGDPNEKL